MYTSTIPLDEAQNADPSLYCIKQYLITNNRAYLLNLTPETRLQVISNNYTIMNNLLYHNKKICHPSYIPSAIPRPKRLIQHHHHHHSQTHYSPVQIMPKPNNNNNNNNINYTNHWLNHQLPNSPSPSTSVSSISPSSLYMQDVYVANKRVQTIGGTTFYAQSGDKLEDYVQLQVPTRYIQYHKHQNILICGECDFSFTLFLVNRRGGYNICSTSWYYYNSQWLDGIGQRIGPQQFIEYLRNLNYIQNKGVKVSFGIDARQLNNSAKQWNVSDNHRFDRIIFTFPRVYNVSKEHDVNKLRYYQENERALHQMLASFHYYLEEKGEIHLMLLKGQFCHFKMSKILKELGLELAYWCAMNKQQLEDHFKPYTPRDFYGSPMMIEQSVIHFVSIRSGTGRVK